MKSWVYLLVLISGLGFQARACKDLLYPDHLTAAEIERFPEIHVVKVLRMDSTGVSDRYASPFQASLKVVQSLRGKLKAGAIFEAKTSSEEGHAACPIALLVGETYLLFFRESAGGLEIPRYTSHYKKIANPEEDVYVRDIRTASSSDRHADAGLLQNEPGTF